MKNRKLLIAKRLVWRPNACLATMNGGAQRGMKKTVQSRIRSTMLPECVKVQMQRDICVHHESNQRNNKNVNRFLLVFVHIRKKMSTAQQCKANWFTWCN